MMEATCYNERVKEFPPTHLAHRSTPLFSEVMKSPNKCKRKKSQNPGFHKKKKKTNKKNSLSSTAKNTEVIIEAVYILFLLSFQAHGMLALSFTLQS